MTALLLALLVPAQAGDWPWWGRDASRNMVTKDAAPRTFVPGDFVPGTETVDMATTRGVRWVAKLGSQTYGNPTIGRGVVLVGTNNAAERRHDLTGDYSVLLAFDEDDGDLRWQLTVPKLGSGKVNDWEFLGICSAAQIVGDEAYVVTTRGEVVGLDLDGHADGNDGFDGEAAYMQGPGAPVPSLDPAIDADLLWVYDVPAELGVFPHNASSNSILVLGDRLFLGTSNGVDWTHTDIPAPFSPAMVAVDRVKGTLLAEEASGISEHTLHSNWSSPTWVPAGKDTSAMVLFGGGDGFLHAFAPEPVDDGGLQVFRELWRVDGNLPEYRAVDGAPVKYATPAGPSEFIATPVYAEGLIFAAIGQDPEHGPGKGLLTAVRPDGSVAWRYPDLHRSISTVAVHKGIVYASDYDGNLHAIAAKDGTQLWVHETGAHIWGSPLVAGRYVYLGDEDGILHVLRTGRKLKVESQISLPAPIYSSPVVANGVLYVATQTHLYAVDGK
ncbi:MAG: PQQ-binding-like beta-propeller repeat protein [Alphaproteobacteria bacterium]|nr:PQQ-binding-like beta-propeller repeat protein [Alphaproteobacteria bacterium]